MRKKYESPQIVCLQIKPSCSLLQDSISGGMHRTTNESFSRGNRFDWDDDNEEDW